MNDTDQDKQDLLRAVARCERYGMHDLAAAYGAQLRALTTPTAGEEN